MNDSFFEITNQSHLITQSFNDSDLCYLGTGNAIRAVTLDDFTSYGVLG